MAKMEVSLKKEIFTGCATATVTPFKDGELDLPALGRLIEKQISGGCSAVVVCGTTGEGSVLTTEERKRIYEYAVKQSGGRYPVLAGTGSNDTHKALSLSLQAQDCGADGVLLVTPYYNKTTQSGLIAHYTYIADRLNIPVLLYNVPTRTGISIAPDTCAELSRHPNIYGIKEASTDVEAITKAMSLCDSDFSFYSGNDSLALPLFALGFKGLISVASHLIPEALSKLCQLCLDGSFAEAAELNKKYYTLFTSLFCEVNPIPVKAALSMLKLCQEEVRLPLIPIGKANREYLSTVLTKYDLV
jgi:4-hydroxy-tetrahydrodipicolinate synthase